MNYRGSLKTVDLRGVRYTGDGVGGVKELNEIIEHQWVEYQSTPELVLVDDHKAFTKACMHCENPRYAIVPPIPEELMLIVSYLSKYTGKTEMRVRCTGKWCQVCAPIRVNPLYQHQPQTV